MVERSSRRPLRSDAARNRDAILDAAVTRLNVSPNASIAEMAEAAGVGRVTMYAHFSSRNELLRAVLDRSMDRVEASFRDVDLDVDPWVALDQLVAVSWRQLADLTGVLAAAEQALPAEVHREHQTRPMARVRELLLKGQAQGAFRKDQPVTWQSACYLAVLHAAAAEVRADRMSEHEAAEFARQSVRALVAPHLRPSVGS